MKKISKLLDKISNDRMLFASSMTSSAVVLVLAAVFISGGGMQKINNALVAAHIISGSQTACVFPCNVTSYSMQALIPQSAQGVNASTFLPNQYFRFQWNAGIYGASYFERVCQGSNGGPSWVCTIQQGSPNYNFNACTPRQCVACQPGWTDENGTCIVPAGCAAWVGPSNCGNADDAYGNACFGTGGGTTPTGSQPGCSNQTAFNAGQYGYDGNWNDAPYGTQSSYFYAPSTPGTYTYYFCSNRLMNAPQGALGCLGTSITVQNPSATCTLSPASQSITQAQNSSWTYSTNNATGVTYSVDGVNRGAPPGNPFTVAGSGLSVGSHTVTMNVTGPTGSGSCGSANNLTVTAVPVPTCTLSNLSGATVGRNDYATFRYTTTNSPTTVTYRVDGAGPYTPGNNPFNIGPNSVGSHTVVMTVTNASGTGTCQGTYTVSGSAPTVSIFANGAASTTVPAGGTTTLSWASLNHSPGGASVSAPSSDGTLTNFVSMAQGAISALYGANYLVANGFLYYMGGYNGSSWPTTNFQKAALGSDFPNNGASWSTAGTLPAGFLHYSKPVVLNGVAYFFGGLNSSGAWVGTVCYVPVALIADGSSWYCTSGTPEIPSGHAISDVVVIGDYLYRFGGYNNISAGAVNSVDRAHVNAPLSWTSFPNVLPQPRFASGVAIVGTYVYLFGGFNGAPVNTIYRAPIASDLTLPASWTSAGTLPQAIHLPTVVVDNNYLYVVGGYSSTAASLNTVYRTSVSNLSAGAPSWTNVATLPTAVYYSPPVIISNKLYLMGGVNGPTYTNRIVSLPFGNGLPYSTPAMMPWLVDGSTNLAVTWPLNVNSVTYTLSGTNSAGTSQATATVSKPDLCTNSPFTGIQNPLPSGVTASGTTCSCATANTYWNGSACMPPPPPSSMSLTPSLDGGVSTATRVRKGGSVSIYWSVAGLINGDTTTSCTVTANPSSAMATQTWNRTGTTWTQGASAPTATINERTTFTLACTNPAYGTVSRTAIVGLAPSYQEQ